MRPDSSHSSPRPIGGSTVRVDSLAKVTGQARYTEDIDMPGLVHAVTARCPHHHARLLALHTAPAARMPGVIRVITAEDVPGENGFTVYSVDEPLLIPVGGTAAMRGAPIALVVAVTRAAAEAGATAIHAEYEVLHHTFDVQDALATDALHIHTDGNVLATFEVVRGDLDAAFDAAEIVLETHYSTSFQEHTALEREAALGYIDEEGRVTVIGGTHEPHWQQRWIAAALGLDPAQVRFVTPPIGGSFGGKQDPWPLIAAGLATFLLKRPVCLAFTRRESFTASPKRHPYEMSYRIGSTQAGTLTGLQVRIAANTGGYDCDGRWIAEYAVTASGSAYRWQAVDARAQSVYTNATKCGQFRGFGTPQPTFALECTLDELIQTLGADPIDFRLQNAIEQDEISFLGYPVAERLGYCEVLESLRPHYRRMQREVDSFNLARIDEPFRKGLGLAGMWYRFGKSGSLRVEAHAELSEAGEFIIYCAAPDYGQGVNTVMTQLAAEAIGAPRDRVRVVNGDTAMTPDSGVQGASRATYWVGNAVCRASAGLRDAVLSAAAEMLDCRPTDLIIGDGVVCHREHVDAVISLRAVAQEFRRMGRADRIVGVFDPSPQFPARTRPAYTPHFVTGAHLAEVLVDMQTGQVRVTRVIAAHDVGRAINPPDARGQINGCILMGIGTALTEQYLPGVTTGLADYIVPMVGEIPEIESILVEVPGYEGPFGAKGLGETPNLPITPAIINALSRAIGVRIRSTPATPERVLQAIRQKEQDRPLTVASAR